MNNRTNRNAASGLSSSTHQTYQALPVRITAIRQANGIPVSASWIVAFRPLGTMKGATICRQPGVNNGLIFGSDMSARSGRRAANMMPDCAIYMMQGCAMSLKSLCISRRASECVSPDLGEGWGPTGKGGAISITAERVRFGSNSAVAANLTASELGCRHPIRRRKAVPLP